MYKGEYTNLKTMSTCVMKNAIICVTKNALEKIGKRGYIMDIIYNDVGVKSPSIVP